MRKNPSVNHASANHKSARAASAPGRPRKSVEDIINPRENQDPSPRRESPQPTDTENPPNENLRKDPDEAYGDTEIPSSHRA
jgi:hypothetical protein